jgi:hypothetical protein
MTAGLEGLREAARSTPPSSPVSSRKDEELEVEADEELVKRMSIVEINLLGLVATFQEAMKLNDTDVVKRKTAGLALPSIATLPIHQPHAYPCSDTFKLLPSPPERWPQAPVMVRPTPGTSTKIRGIRLANQTDYQNFPGFCAGCILPINTGRETPGNSLVIDFESTHFVGTVLFRIKDIPPPPFNKGESLGTHCYFDGKKRKFQAVIKGKFKTPLSMSECVTGQEFYRMAGRLPAHWIVSSFIRFVSTLAPQLEASIDGDRPRFLTPLIATAHTCIAKATDNTNVIFCQTVNSDDDGNSKEDEKLLNYSIYPGSHDMEKAVEEPPANDPTSLMQVLNNCSTATSGGSVASRMKARKKAFNQVTAQHLEEPKFRLDTEYCFEFYQHLLLFGRDTGLALDMGRPIGKVPLAPCTNGQPIKVMGAHKDPTTGELDTLWSFDIWHESLYEYAKLYD